MSDILKVYSPYDNHFIKSFPLADEARVELILSKAYSLFNDASRRLEKYERISILEKLAGLMEGRVEELTGMAAEEGGKPYADSKVEVLRAINGVKLAVAELYNLKGEEIPMGMTRPSVNRLAFTTREPIGVVLSISAFNHPLNLIIHQVIPPLAVGCPVIVKPASTTPVSCFNLVDMLYEAGLPKDYCQALVCNRSMAEKMAADPRINFLSFIGSAGVGWRLRSILAPGTRTALEHGGVAPVIIDKTAVPGEFLPGMMKGGFYHAGQVCVSVQRIFIHEEIAWDVANMMAEQAAQLIVGDPLKEETEVGPLIAPEEVDRVEEWVNEKGRGGEILTGGRRLSDTLFAPTVIWNPSFDARVSTSEVFGPVICIYPFKNLPDAVKQANDLEFAFQAAVFSKDIDFCMKAVKELNASAVMVNDHTAFRVDWMPFGGRDSSGIGIGGIPFSMREMTREKLIVIRSKSL